MELVGVVATFLLLALFAGLYGYDSRDGIDRAEPWRYGVWMDEARNRRNGLLRAVTGVPTRDRSVSRRGPAPLTPHPIPRPVSIAHRRIDQRPIVM